jgi:hypothetical protein
MSKKCTLSQAYFTGSGGGCLLSLLSLPSAAGAGGGAMFLSATRTYIATADFGSFDRSIVSVNGT